ncbi:hypothetical protein HOLleu_01724 [Holothuria leucospilota]|uniref:BESS domain-containing protein n=1 Tax=Holothuria leucospilota TaxID=206669 RepID=A0A9Q1HL26_HOLLE|nr:hypothetical protein HOLleu_01724 [Holothuria leucospilota]
MWKNLKDSYRQATNAELKRMKSGSGAISKKPWKFMELMSFLKPFVSTESGSCSNVLVPPNAEYDSDVEVVQAAAMQCVVHHVEDSQEEDTKSQDDIVPEIEARLEFSSSRSTMVVRPAVTPKHVSNAVGRKRKTATDDVDRSLLDFIAEAEQTQASLLEKVTPEPSADNEENLMGKSVAAALRRLTPYKRAFAKVKIQELLFEIEFGTQDDQHL